jgi:hypothetical protein
LNSVKLLLVRVERDSPVFYLLVKRLIHRTFSIIILACCLLHLGRAPIPLLTRKVNNDEFRMNQLKVGGLSWSNRIWSTFFFDYCRWNRPLRYIENSRFSNKGLVKKTSISIFFWHMFKRWKTKNSFYSFAKLIYFWKRFEKIFKHSEFFFFIRWFLRWMDWYKKEKKRNFLLGIRE